MVVHAAQKDDARASAALAGARSRRPPRRARGSLARQRDSDPGTRFRVGLDPILGLALPAVGDAVGGFVSLGMLFLAVQYRVPTPIIGRMVVNIAVDTVIGGIPIVGDVFDFGWKANERNFELIAMHRGDLPRRTSPRYWLAVIGLLLVGLICVAAPIALVVWLIIELGSG